jgi:hypothetical protein
VEDYAAFAFALALVYLQGQTTTLVARRGVEAS